ncbi:MAG: hypothetical protein H6Q12_38 [Bacteroidetes bacterium]|nr:hypothetical protein [Bacteroidota bacterium]
MKSSSASAVAQKSVSTVVANNVKEQKESPKLVLLPVKSEKKETEAEKKKVEEQNEIAVIPQTRALTMEELTDKAERLHLLKLKYEEVKAKRKQLENFSISHDQNNAQLTLIDAKGASITTSNPQSIGKLLIDWMADLNTHLASVENDMRKQLA